MNTWKITDSGSFQMLHRLDGMPPSQRPSKEQMAIAKSIADILSPRARVLHTLCKGWRRRPATRRLSDQERAESKRRQMKRRMEDAKSLIRITDCDAEGMNRVEETTALYRQYQSLKRWARICELASEIWLRKNGFRISRFNRLH